MPACLLHRLTCSPRVSVCCAGTVWLHKALIRAVLPAPAFPTGPWVCLPVLGHTVKRNAFQCFRPCYEPKACTCHRQFYLLPLLALFSVLHR